jgi:hypothetical protein
MRFDQAERHDDMKAAHADAAVQIVVERYLMSPSAVMSYLLVTALYSNYHPGPAAVQTMLMWAPVSDDDEPAAREMVEACLTIGNRFQHDWDARGCRNGAIIEALTERLCGQRSTDVAVEQHVGPLPPKLYFNGRSKPMDVLVKDDRLLEVYECKSDPKDLTDEDAVELDAIADLAADEDQPIRLAVASLQDRDYVQDALADLRFRTDLRVATREDLHALADGPPTEPARRPAA